jgi:hypothetical protein
MVVGPCDYPVNDDLEWAISPDGSILMAGNNCLYLEDESFGWPLIISWLPSYGCTKFAFTKPVPRAAAMQTMLMPQRPHQSYHPGPYETAARMRGGIAFHIVLGNGWCLMARGVTVSPFLAVSAEPCQTSLLQSQWIYDPQSLQIISRFNDGCLTSSGGTGLPSMTPGSGATWVGQCSATGHVYMAWDFNETFGLISINGTAPSHQRNCLDASLVGIGNWSSPIFTQTWLNCNGPSASETWKFVTTSEAADNSLISLV